MKSSAKICKILFPHNTVYIGYTMEILKLSQYTDRETRTNGTGVSKRERALRPVSKRNIS